MCHQPSGFGRWRIIDLCCASVKYFVTFQNLQPGDKIFLLINISINNNCYSVTNHYFKIGFMPKYWPHKLENIWSKAQVTICFCYIYQAYVFATCPQLWECNKYWPSVVTSPKHFAGDKYRPSSLLNQSNSVDWKNRDTRNHNAHPNHCLDFKMRNM